MTINDSQSKARKSLSKPTPMYPPDKSENGNAIISRRANGVVAFRFGSTPAFCEKRKSNHPIFNSAAGDGCMPITKSLQDGHRYRHPYGRRHYTALIDGACLTARPRPMDDKWDQRGGLMMA